jgi:hypothetical protein
MAERLKGCEATGEAVISSEYEGSRKDFSQSLP